MFPDQAQRKNVIKGSIDHRSDKSKCRLCKEKEKPADHLSSTCSKIAQTDYLERQNRLASMLQWNLCNELIKNFSAAEKWWVHKAEKVLQKDHVKILWNSKIQTEKTKHLAQNNPNPHHVGLEKAGMRCGHGNTGDSKMEQKELEKITKNQDLKVEVKRLWEKKTTVLPMVMGALWAQKGTLDLK